MNGCEANDSHTRKEQVIKFQALGVCAGNRQSRRAALKLIGVDYVRRHLEIGERLSRFHAFGECA